MTSVSTRASPSRDSLEELFTGAANLIERLPMLRLALEKAAPACAEGLRSVCTGTARLALTSLQMGAAEKEFGVPEGATVTAVLHAPKWGTRVLASASRDVILTIVELALGGDGSAPPVPVDRSLSRIELRIAKLFFDRVAGALAEAFVGIAETPFLVEGVGLSIDYDVIGQPSDVLAVARYRIEIGPASGDVLVGIPKAALTPLRQALGRSPSKDAPAPDPRWTQQIQTELERAQVVLTAVLDERLGILGEVFNLRVGQVIELNATAKSRVRLECNGERLFWCQLGKSQGKYTLQVDEAVDREQEFMDDILSV